MNIKYNFVRLLRFLETVQYLIFAIFNTCLCVLYSILYSPSEMRIIHTSDLFILCHRSLKPCSFFLLLLSSLRLLTRKGQCNCFTDHGTVEATVFSHSRPASGLDATCASSGEPRVPDPRFSASISSPERKLSPSCSFGSLARL